MTGILAGLVSVGALSWASAIAVVGFTSLGAWDDWSSRTAGLRLAAQCLLGLGVLAALLGDGLTSIRPDLAVVIVGISCFIVIVNVVNFMDGANGMSATHGLLFGIVYAALSWQAGASTWALLALSLAAASAAFMPWNFRKTALLFLGDSGSYLFGGILALLVLVCWAQGTPLVVAIAPLSIYLSDVGVTLIRRGIAGRPILQSHRGHAYQSLTARGWDHRMASLLVLVFSGACCVLALMAQVGFLSGALLGLLLTIVVSSYFFVLLHVLK